MYGCLLVQGGLLKIFEGMSWHAIAFSSPDRYNYSSMLSTSCIFDACWVCFYPET